VAQQRIAEVPVHWWHRARGDAPFESVAYDDVVAGAQSLEKRGEHGEIVAIVAVSHHRIATLRRREAGAQRGAVPALGHWHDARTKPGSERLRAIRASVVGDDDLPGDRFALEEATCL
jgi:hypothetical protein